MYPFDIEDLGSKETQEVFKYFSESGQDGYIRVGPKGYFFTNGFRKMAEEIYNMPVRPDDTWVITFPKSGTTWVQELVWLVANDFDFDKAKSIPLVTRFPFLEMSMLANSAKGQRKMLEMCSKAEHAQIAGELAPDVQALAGLPSPRYLKTHLPLSLLPPAALDTCKMVTVARDPRDTAVSYYHHNKFFRFMGYTGGFKEFWNYFVNDMLDWTPYFENVKESWEQRHHPNMLFMFYEDLLEDLPLAVRRVADFLGKEMSEEQLAQACDHLSFHNFKNNKSVNFEFAKELGFVAKEGSFIRKGKAGDWHEYFDAEMAAQAQRWIEDNLRGTDLRFPTLT